jgi:hypothetical protein
MNEKIQTPTEYEVGTEFVFNGEPEAPNVVVAGIGRAVETIKLETRMLVFDALHGTDYRAIRHNLVAEQKRRKFEESIGLIATGKHQ